MRDCRLVRWTREGRSGTSFLWFAVSELVAAGPGNNETTMDGRDRVAVVRYW